MAIVQLGAAVGAWALLLGSRPTSGVEVKQQGAGVRLSCCSCVAPDPLFPLKIHLLCARYECVDSVPGVMASAVILVVVCALCLAVHRFIQGRRLQKV